MSHINVKAKKSLYIFHGEYDPYLHDGKIYTFYQKGSFESKEQFVGLKKIKIGRGIYKLDDDKMILTYKEVNLDTAEIRLKTAEKKPAFLNLKCCDLASKGSVGNYNYQLIDSAGNILKSGIIHADSSLFIHADLFSLVKCFRLHHEEYPNLTFFSDSLGDNVEEINIFWKNLNTEFETPHVATYHIINIKQPAATVESFELVDYFDEGKALTWKRYPLRNIPFELWRKE